MNINRIPPDILRLYGGRTQGTRGGSSSDLHPIGGNEETTAPGRGDDVVLSQGAASLSRAHAAAIAAPDVREGLVASIREQVQNGTYQPADEAVAHALLQGAGQE